MITILTRSSPLFNLPINFTVNLCSEVKGRITLEGKPFANQKLERSLTYEEEEVDYVYTDENGCFSFSPKSIKSKLPGSILHEARVRIVIVVKYNDEYHVLWYGTQQSRKTDTEFAKRFLNLNAELTDEEITHRFDSPQSSLGHNIKSICRWT